MGQSVWRPLIIMLLFVVFFNLMYGLLLREGEKGAVISYSRFRAELTADNLKKVTFKGEVSAVSSASKPRWVNLFRVKRCPGR